MAVLLTSGTLVNKSAVNPGDNGSMNLSCCDTGNGDSCKPQTGAGQTLTFKGTEYGLLRTKMSLVEGNLHLKDSGETFNGDPIILNSSEKHAVGPGYEVVKTACKRPDPISSPKDLYFTKNPQDPYMFMKAGSANQLANYCDSIPDDELIFVCKQNCVAAACSYPVPANDNISCYGNDKSVFDVYYRLSDTANNGIPDFIKNCDKASLPTINPTNIVQRIVTPTGIPGKKDNLQLKTFEVKTENNTVPWLSPLCKPAIYLYPESTMPVSVKINPVGPIKLTIPPYPVAGWNVIAHPDGLITSNNVVFDYLYYEAEIPDGKIEKPHDGYVIERDQLSNLLENILPKLGLNNKEKNQFVEYWTKVLPNTPYYFVGIVPVSNLDTISPLSIIPKPTTSIRVILYFEALDEFKTVQSPQLSNTNRSGFTMVEWGGIFKKNPNYPFSCFQ